MSVEDRSIMSSSSSTSRVLLFEQKLGFPSSGGILRATNRKEIMEKHPIWKQFTNGIQELTNEIVNYERWSLDQIRSFQLTEKSERLFHHFGSGLWPDDRGKGTTPWLAISTEDDLGGRYPKDLFYSDEKDRKLLLETFNENVRLKCEGKHGRTITKSWDWKYVSSRKRKRPSGIHPDVSACKRKRPSGVYLECDAEGEQEEDRALSVSDDDYEPGRGVGDDASSELSELSDDTVAGATASVVESTTRQTPPSVGNTPPSRVDSTLANRKVLHQNRAAGLFSTLIPPTAPRSMLAEQAKRVFDPFPMASYQPPPVTRHEGLSLSTQHPTRAPTTYGMAPPPTRFERPHVPVLADQFNHMAAPFHMSQPALSTAYLSLSTQAQQLCKSMLDNACASAPQAHSVKQRNLQNDSNHGKSPPTDNVQKSGRSYNHYFDFGNIDSFKPNYHPSLPLSWRRGQESDRVVYEGDQTGLCLHEPDKAHHAVEYEPSPHTAPVERSDVTNVSDKSTSPDVLTADFAVGPIANSNEAQIHNTPGPRAVKLAGEANIGLETGHNTLADTSALTSSSRKQKVEQRNRCDVCKAQRKKCDKGLPCGYCLQKDRPDLCLYSPSIPRRRRRRRVHFTPSPTQSLEPEEQIDQRQQALSSHGAASDVDVSFEAVSVGPDLPNSGPQSSEADFDRTGNRDSNPVPPNNVMESDSAEVARPCQDRNSPTNWPEGFSQSPERSHDNEDVKQELDAVKREPLSPEYDEPIAEEGTQENPVDLDLDELHTDHDDLPPRNNSCVEVDAGDGVAFCTNFKICKSTDEFFAFVSSLVPSDIQAGRSSDMISSVMVRFANPTKLDTSKMRVYRQRGNPTIMRLNEQLNAPMESGDPALKFIVEWQKN